MSDARIEIRSNNVKNMPAMPFLGAPQHLFIVYIDSNGKETALRGGPEKNTLISALHSDVKITNLHYDENHVDWDPNAPSIEIARGTDVEMQALVDKMWAHAQQINKEGFDYKLPFIGHIQNSNTAVNSMVKTAGLELKLPLHQSGQKVWAPGIDGHFTHTFLDTYTDKDAANVLSSSQYERVVSSDFAQISYMNKQTGGIVYTEETGARKMGNYIFVRGVSEEEVAARYNVPVDRVSENYFMSYDALGRPTGQTIFTIMPTQSEKEIEGDILTDTPLHSLTESLGFIELLALMKLLKKEKKLIEKEVLAKIQNEIDYKTQALSAEREAKHAALQAASDAECDAKAEIVKANTPCGEHNSYHREGNCLTGPDGNSNCLHTYHCKITVDCSDIAAKYNQELANYKKEQLRQFKDWNTKFLEEQEELYQQRLDALKNEYDNAYEMVYGHKPISQIFQDGADKLHAESNTVY